MRDKIRFVERGVEEFLAAAEINSVFNWQNTPELLHVGLTDIYMGGVRRGKLASISTVWLPANRAMGEGIPEYETLVSGLAEHHDDLSTLDRWRSRDEALAGHERIAERTRASFETAHIYDDIHLVTRDHTYRTEGAS